MSITSSSPPSSDGPTPRMQNPPHIPSPPLTPPLMAVKVTLPTPPSFSTRRSQMGNIPKAAVSSSPHESDSGPNGARRVSFIDSTEASPPLYRIPQRQASSPHDTTSRDVTGTRKAPPSLKLVSGSPAPGVIGSGRRIPSTAPSSLGSNASGTASRFSLTAAAKGLSIDQALSRGAGSLAATGGSIWSAGITGMGSGWISPALASARSTGTGTRARGLTVAVISDGPEGGKEMIMESEGVVTPPAKTTAMLSPPLKSPVALESPMISPSAGIPTEHKRKEIILCRYYHTPGLTCTSRPCRFVHALDTIAQEIPNSSDINSYRMLSPSALTPGDTSMGIFETAQAARLGVAPKSPLSAIPEVKPGEVVRVAGEDGKEVVGTVFLMSGGGKGPAGKSRSKYKTVACKDFADGHCPYGEYCSFIHDEQYASGGTALSPSVETASPPDHSALSASAKGDKAERRRSYNDSLKIAPNAWSRAPMGELAIRANVLEKHQDHLSAFAPPFGTESVIVNSAGELIPPPAIAAQKEKTAPKNAWAKGPPPNLNKVTIANLSTPPGRTPRTPINANGQYLTVPNSATSMFGTDSDPATPWDPIVQARQLAEAQARAAASSSNEGAEVPTLQIPNSTEAYSYSPTEALPYGPYTPMFTAPTYPWGMPMSPMGFSSTGVSTQGVTAIPTEEGGIPGGPGVLWTPAGWAVQDAAMKSALRDAEIKVKLPNVKFKQPKSYYRTKPCKFFADGHCPHGDECTYLHEIPASSDSSSDSDRPHPPNYRTLPCKFFNSAAGCSNGESCTFLHTLVVPVAAPLVDRPRPWRTRPCRHFQLNRCTLGDACHFAHVIDPTRKNINSPCPELMQWGTCKFGDACKYSHPDLSEQQVELGVKIMRSMKVSHGDEEDSDDDVEIVTEDTTRDISPPLSALAF